MFTVTITETTVREEILPKSWERFTDNPKEGEGNYGYAPETTTKKDVTVQLYQQRTDVLDLVAVIQAINGITP